MEDLGLDLAEYALSETDRTLKRLGITHRWRECTTTPAVEPRATDAPANQPSSPGTDQTPPPPAWLRFLFHGKQPPVKTLWTYQGLGQDLASVTTPPRLELFRKIQAAACAQGGWAERDICVWPIEASECVAGLEFFQPRLILVFGALPAEAMPTTPPGNILLHGIPLHELPGLDEMLAGDKTAKNAAWEFLKTLAPRDNAGLR